MIDMEKSKLLAKLNKEKRHINGLEILIQCIEESFLSNQESFIFIEKSVDSLRHKTEKNIAGAWETLRKFKSEHELEKYEHELATLEEIEAAPIENQREILLARIKNVREKIEMCKNFLKENTENPINE